MRTSHPNKIAGLLLAVFALFGSATVSATTTFPALELNPVNVTGSASGLTMTGLAPFVLSDATTTLFDLVPDLSFDLTSDASGAGTLLVDGGAALSASFSNLSIVYTGFGTASWYADLTYTGGSLAGSLTGGRVEGGFSGITGFTDPTDIGLSLLGQTFSGAGNAKLGAVVPVPAAVWLFGSGLLGLAGIARRRTKT
jgi:hypothetical protein